MPRNRGLLRKAYPLPVFGLLLGNIILFSAVPAASADSTSSSDVRRPEPIGLAYRQENDGPWLNPFDGTDRYYTHGIALGVTHQPDWALEVAETIPFMGEVLRSGMSYLIAHEIYTPANLKETAPISRDRPYAGYGYLGIAHYRASTRAFDYFRLDVGALGPVTRAKEIQSFAHERWGGRDPKGWNNQIRNEPTAQLWIDRRWRLKQREGLEIQLLPAAGLGVGTVYGELRLGAVVRVGSNLPRDFGPSPFATPKGPRPTELPAPTRPIGVYAFAGAAGRTVAHNRLIAGNDPSGEVGRSVEFLAGEYQAGIAVLLRLGTWSVGTRYTQRVVSPEFRGQRKPHRYGGVLFSIATHD